MDGLIDWLREKRQSSPRASLADLLSHHPVNADRLIDLACIDLMQRRRMGQEAIVENYLDQFPCLADQSLRLDLIDAEICVAHELGICQDVEHYVERFPDLADAIGQLMQLDGQQQSTSLLELIDSRHAGQDSTSCSADSGSSTQNVLAEPGLPVDVPDWFIPEKCVASSPGRWLIRGRDSSRRTALAMKVVELPAQVTPKEQSSILEACEQAAKVQNPCWVVPLVAAVQHRRLAVIRPWLFGHRWQHAIESAQRESELRSFASVAYALQAAHDAGATHGGLHLENVLIDHGGKVQLIDAVVSRDGLTQWLRGQNGPSPAPRPSLFQRRRDHDLQSLIKLVAAASVDWQCQGSGSLLGQLRQISQQHANEGGGRMGDLLIQFADQRKRPSNQAPSPGLRWWPTKWMRWISGNG
ncbi:MAG: hypothetical protein MI861_04945, partial [Pirellulales bacterium]|nr:hypothetical protein [Pirellulales bacterium]